MIHKISRVGSCTHKGGRRLTEGRAFGEYSERPKKSAFFGHFLVDYCLDIR